MLFKIISKFREYLPALGLVWIGKCHKIAAVLLYIEHLCRVLAAPHIFQCNI